MPTGALPLLVNLDVPDPGAAATLYIAAFGLRHGRRLGDGAAIELLGATSPLYLLEKATGSTGAGSRPRD